MMLRYFDLIEPANCIEKAVHRCIQRGQVTQDLNPENYISTFDVGDAVIENMQVIKPIKLRNMASGLI